MLLPTGARLPALAALIVGVLSFQVATGAGALQSAGSGRLELFLTSLGTLIVLVMNSIGASRERKRLAQEAIKEQARIADDQRKALELHNRELLEFAKRDEEAVRVQIREQQNQNTKLDLSRTKLDEIQNLTNGRLTETLDALNAATKEIAELKETNSHLVSVIADMSATVKGRATPARRGKKKP